MGLSPKLKRRIKHLLEKKWWVFPTGTIR